MNSRALPLAAVALLFACTAAVWHSSAVRRAVGSIAVAAWPYLPGSRIPVRVDGFAGPYLVRVLGAGRLGDGGAYEIPITDDGGVSTLIAANAVGLAATSFRVAAPLATGRDEIAVASYDDGIVFHRTDDFAVDGVLAIGGAPGDVATAGDRAIAPDTQGDDVTLVSRRPWNVDVVARVPLGDQVAFDASGDAFVTDREFDGRGGLTRVSRDGAVTSVVTGLTAEGIAIDSKRGIAYVANANDGSVAVVGLHSMRVLRSFHAVDRVFSLALDQPGTHLYAVSNQSAEPPFGAAGSVVSFDVRSRPRVVARSGDLTFPLGVAYDRARHRLFVTDESADVIYVLDAGTLRSQRSPLSTCKTPWKPYLDERSRRLYVPCARSGEVDAFDSATLRRVAGAPFATGGYPLAVSVVRAAKASHA